MYACKSFKCDGRNFPSLVLGPVVFAATCQSLKVTCMRVGGMDIPHGVLGVLLLRMGPEFPQPCSHPNIVFHTHTGTRTSYKYIQKEQESNIKVSRTRSHHRSFCSSIFISQPERKKNEIRRKSRYRPKSIYKEQQSKDNCRRWQDSNLRPRRELISSQSH